MSWYKEWFNDLYPKIYPHRNLAEAELQVNAISKFITSTDSCLDIACGTGRHLKYLSKIFKKAVGIDLSEDLIQIGLEQGNFNDAQVLHADMRNPPFSTRSFDLITNFFTGFGYFETDQEHQELIITWADLLKKNGILIIDYLNREKVIKDLIPESHREIDGYKITEYRSISQNGQRIEKKIIISSNNFSKTFNESVRMYNVEEISKMISKCNLMIMGEYGNFNWQRYNLESERLIIVAKNDKAI